MKKFVAAVGLCILAGGLLAACSSNDSACEKACDRLYDGSTAQQCRDMCND